MRMRVLSIAALFAVVLLWAMPLDAQRKYALEDLPEIPLDTLDTAKPNVKIITFANNTWKYYFSDYESLINQDVFRDHWVTNQVFAYKDVKIGDIPETMEIELVKSLSDFHPPVLGRVSSRYGPRGRGMHKGIDVGLPTGEPIYATFEGRVRYARYNSGGYGYLVIIRHPNGLETYYGHLCKLNVDVDDYVVAGQVIGYGGNTGRSRGPHLHFEVRYADLTFDPERIIDFSTGELKWQNFVLERGYFNVSSKLTEALEEDEGDMGELFVDKEGKPLSSEEIVENLEKAASKPKPTVNDAVYYKVKSGDNLSKIAAKYGTTVGAICRLNGIKSTTPIRIGQRLRVK
ncbi:MAG: peptidoglycan DD-metalloendopeptidase family protein [Tidjanibacter sp.]|nr:peptidoglycan DD-metalloendopeptidase family protein [Tidjanibacter sp.]